MIVQQVLDGFNYSFCGSAIPQFRYDSLTGFSRKDVINQAFKIFNCAKLVGTLLNGDWPLGIGPHGQARNTEVGGLFLNASGVGDSETTIEHKIHEADIIQRLHRV